MLDHKNLVVQRATLLKLVWKDEKQLAGRRYTPSAKSI